MTETLEEQTQVKCPNSPEKISLKDCTLKLKFKFPDCKECRPEHFKLHKFVTTKDEIHEAVTKISDHDVNLNIHACSYMLNRVRKILDLSGKSFMDVVKSIRGNGLTPHDVHEPLNMELAECFKNSWEDFVFEYKETKDVKKILYNIVKITHDACKETDKNVDPKQLDKELLDIKKAFGI